MGKYLLFHRHHVVKLLLWIGMEGGDIHYVIEGASCCSQCCFQVFKSKPHLFLKIRLRRSVCVTAYGLKQTVNHQNGWLRNTHVPHTENGGQQEKPRYVAS